LFSSFLGAAQSPRLRYMNNSFEKKRRLADQQMKNTEVDQLTS